MNARALICTKCIAKILLHKDVYKTQCDGEVDAE